MLEKDFFNATVAVILANGDHGSFQSKIKELIERVHVMKPHPLI